MQNLEFYEALSKRVLDIYNSSWIVKYYTFLPIYSNGVVQFIDREKNNVDSNRFQILIYVPKETQAYFLPASDWAEFENTDLAIKTEFLSNVVHGFRIKSYNSSQSLFYREPYYIYLKSPSIQEPNCLLFNDFLKPNHNDSILCLLIYDDRTARFINQFETQITLPYLSVFTFNHTLEFCVRDANKKEIALVDGSQLFIQLTVNKDKSIN